MKDYGVYLEQHTGISRFNPFVSQEQLVLFLTDRGTYCVFVRGMGEFCEPTLAKNMEVTVVGKKLFCGRRGKQYRFVRKWREGCCGDYAAFVENVQATV